MRAFHFSAEKKDGAKIIEPEIHKYTQFSLRNFQRKRERGERMKTSKNLSSFVLKTICNDPAAGVAGFKCSFFRYGTAFQCSL